ncbi:MAG: mechanosensitive ion channel [Gemmatimonadetes bacterium]|nr:mechanosensitive ion channel [Gemmatimonadota bacterium]
MTPTADPSSAVRRLFVRVLHGDDLLVALLQVAVILGLALLANRILKRVARRVVERADDGDANTLTEREQRAQTLAQLLTYTGNIVIGVAAVLGILAVFIDIGPILAGAGVVGLAVAVGGQTIVRDFITGFFLLTEQQFAVGDRVRIGGVEGVVHRISLRMVVLRGDDGTLHYVANGSISAVSNLSRARNGAG